MPDAPQAIPIRDRSGQLIGMGSGTYASILNLRQGRVMSGDVVEMAHLYANTIEQGVRCSESIVIGRIAHHYVLTNHESNQLRR